MLLDGYACAFRRILFLDVLYAIYRVIWMGLFLDGYYLFLDVSGIYPAIFRRNSQIKAILFLDESHF